jgi:SAM-dependent methyltransferase
MTPPACPCCDATDARAVQVVGRKLLRGLWRAQFGVDTGELPNTTLFECDCGARFFHPATPGDAAFYGALYRHFRVTGWMARPASDRADFMAAVPHVQAGDAVLDVGAHNGAFGTLLPAGTRYTAIDAHADTHAQAGVLAETAAEHAARHPAQYDLVCAFQVIEHVAAPQALARDMLAALRPGGLLVLAGPTWPSAMTAIPNMAINAPPHHITWWSPRAFAGFAQRLGLEVVEARNVEGGASLREGYHWLRRLLPAAPPERPYRHSWPLHARLALAAALRRPLNALFGTGRESLVVDALLVARKPA